MPYPRHLELDETTEQDLINWIDSELVSHLAERDDWIERLERYQSDYNAEPSSEMGTFPFKGSSTIIVPLTAIAYEAVHSRTMQTAYALDQKVAVKIYSEDKALEPALEKFLDQVLEHDVKFRQNTEPAVMELEKFGTGVAVAEYEDVRKTGIRVNEDDEEEEFEVIVHQGPCVRSVPISSFLQPFDNDNTQTARWCGEVFWLTPNEIRSHERDGFFKEGTYENLRRYYNPPTPQDTAGSYQATVDAQQGREPSWPERIPFYKIYTAYDVDTADYDKEIVFIYHRDSRSIVAIWYNWFEDLRRPYRKGNYFPVEFRWAGVGIAKQGEMFQRHVTSIHRQRLDNGTIANLRMFKVKRDADIKEDEPLFPGKLWFLDDLGDVEPLEMGDVKVSAYNNENAIQLLHQQRTGVNELTLGMPQAGTPGTATDSMARVQESARKFDYTYNNISMFLSELTKDTLCNIVQWGPNPDRIAIAHDSARLERFLRNPYELFRNEIICSVSRVGQNQNRLLDRQNMQQVTAMIQQYYTSLITLAQTLGDQELLKNITTQGIIAANEAMLQVLQTFDFRNLDKFLFKLPENYGQPNNPNAGIAGGATPNSAITSNINTSNIMAPNLTSVLPQGASYL